MISILLFNIQALGAEPMKLRIKIDILQILHFLLLNIPNYSPPQNDFTMCSQVEYFFSKVNNFEYSTVKSVIFVFYHAKNLIFDI